MGSAAEESGQGGIIDIEIRVVIGTRHITGKGDFAILIAVQIIGTAGIDPFAVEDDQFGSSVPVQIVQCKGDTVGGSVKGIAEGLAAVEICLVCYEILVGILPGSACDRSARLHCCALKFYDISQASAVAGNDWNDVIRDIVPDPPAFLLVVVHIHVAFLDIAVLKTGLTDHPLRISPVRWTVQGFTGEVVIPIYPVIGGRVRVAPSADPEDGAGGSCIVDLLQNALVFLIGVNVYKIAACIHGILERLRPGTVGNDQTVSVLAARTACLGSRGLDHACCGKHENQSPE